LPERAGPEIRAYRSGDLIVKESPRRNPKRKKAATTVGRSREASSRVPSSFLPTSMQRRWRLNSLTAYWS